MGAQSATPIVWYRMMSHWCRTAGIDVRSPWPRAAGGSLIAHAERKKARIPQTWAEGSNLAFCTLGLVLVSNNTAETHLCSSEVRASYLGDKCAKRYCGS